MSLEAVHGTDVHCNTPGCLATIRVAHTDPQLARTAANAAGWMVGIPQPGKASCGLRADYCPDCRVP